VNNIILVEPLDRGDLQSQFGNLVEQAERIVAPSSARVYRQTFRAWLAWTEANGLNPFALTFAHVGTFLDEQDATKATKQRQLSALRSLLRLLSAVDGSNPQWNALYQSLKLLKVSRMSSGGQERERRALTPEEVWKAFAVWEGDTLAAVRNRALLAVLFYVGARRSEIVSLRWSDVNLDDGILHIRHGKGDEERDATIVGDNAIEALQEWRERQATTGDQRDYVFCALVKGEKLGLDQPMTDHALWKMVKETGRRSGIAFAPHDARRSLATELLSLNAPLADVQAQLGHKREATTLRYAQPASAKARRGRLKTRY
jgi:site-specific recombinase XerD